jgi:alpha-1,2-mannosyltransferase
VVVVPVLTFVTMSVMLRRRPGGRREGRLAAPPRYHIVTLAVVVLPGTPRASGNNESVPPVTSRTPAAPVDTPPIPRLLVRDATALPTVLGILVVVVSAAPVLVIRLLVTPPQHRIVDLEVYREAGISVLIGRPVYEHVTAVPHLLPFTYPPISALLSVPLAAIPLGLAQLLWSLAVIGTLAWVVHVAFQPLLQRFDRWQPTAYGVVTGAMLWLLPIQDQVRFGQVGLFLVALVLADLVVRQRRPPVPPRWWGRTGTLVGLGTALKLTPGVFLVYLALCRRWRAALTAAGTAALLTIVAFLVLPGDSATFWFRSLLDSERLGSNSGTSNQSIRGLLLHLDMDQTWLWLLLAVTVAVIGFRAALYVHRAGNELAAITIVGLLSCLLSPVAWIHHLAWLPLALAVVVGDGRDRRRVMLAVGLWLWFVLRTPWYGTAMLAQQIGPSWFARFLQQGYGLAAIALVIVLVGVVRRDAMQRAGLTA